MKRVLVRGLTGGAATVVASNDLGVDSARVVVLPDDETLFEVVARCPTDYEIELFALTADVEFRGDPGQLSP